MVLTNRARGRCSMFVCSARQEEKFSFIDIGADASAGLPSLAKERRRPPASA
jgi:hypothetical protein